MQSRSICKTKEASVCFCIVILCCWAFSVQGCGKSEEIRFNPGYNISTYPAPNTNDFYFTLFLPSNTSQVGKLPLLVYLNWGGIEQHGRVAHSVNFGVHHWRIASTFPCALLALQCTNDGSWAASSENTQSAMKILEEMITDYGFDRERIHLVGVSAGGSGVWEISSAFADKFASAVPICGIGVERSSLSNVNLPVWNFCNEKDKRTLVETNRSLESALLTNGLSPIYTEYHKAGHDCWSQAFCNKALFEWLLRQSRSKNKLESEKFMIIDSQIQQRNEATVGRSGELVCSANGVFNSMNCGDFPNLLDFHFHAKYDDNQSLALHIESVNSDEHMVLNVPFAFAGPATFAERSRNVFAYISPRGQNQLDPKGWNDIRLRVEKDHIYLMINGFEAFDQHIDLSDVKGWRVSFQPSGGKDSEVRFRYLRWRPLTWLMTSAD